MGEQDLALDVMHKGKSQKLVACFPCLKTILRTWGNFTVIAHCLENWNLNPAPSTGKL